jgi:hypothetical protein
MSAFEPTTTTDDEPVETIRGHDSVCIPEEDIPGLAYNQSVRLTAPLTHSHTQSLSPPLPTPTFPTTVPVPITPVVKKPSEEPKQPSDFLFGRCLGEGAYARVVHAKLKKNDNQFAIKIMEKMHIKKENKVMECSHSLTHSLTHSFIHSFVH